MFAVIDNSIVQLLLGTSCGLLVFIGKSVIGKLENGNRTLEELAKNIAVIKEKMETYNSRITTLESDNKRIIENVHDLQIKINGLSSKLTLYAKSDK